MNPTKINIVGVQIDNLSKDEAIAKIDSFIISKNPHYVVTPYSEMIVFAREDEIYRGALNQAHLSLPDGIGIIFAAKFFGMKIKERIVGRKFIFDLAKLSESKKYSMALVGGLDDVATKTADKLKEIFPNLKINLTLSPPAFDESVIQKISESNSDILLIGYSPPKQELWLSQNYLKLNTKVAIGLGGTFDYLAGKHPVPPNFMHQMGLEWFWRLITQPWRIKRIWNAVPVFIWKVFKYKLLMSHPERSEGSNK